MCEWGKWRHRQRKRKRERARGKERVREEVLSLSLTSPCFESQSLWCTAPRHIYLRHSSGIHPPNPRGHVSFLNLPLLCQHLFCNGLAGTLSSRPQLKWQISAAPTASPADRHGWGGGAEAGCHVNTDDVTSGWFVFGDESDRISHWKGFFCLSFFPPKLVSHSGSRQMLGPVGLEQAEDGWRDGVGHGGMRGRGYEGNFTVSLSLPRCPSLHSSIHLRLSHSSLSVFLPRSLIMTSSHLESFHHFTSLFMFHLEDGRQKWCSSI